MTMKAITKKGIAPALISGFLVAALPGLAGAADSVHGWGYWQEMVRPAAGLPQATVGPNVANRTVMVAQGSPATPVNPPQYRQDPQQDESGGSNTGGTQSASSGGTNTGGTGGTEPAVTPPVAPSPSHYVGYARISENDTSGEVPQTHDGVARVTISYDPAGDPNATGYQYDETVAADENLPAGQTHTGAYSLTPFGKLAGDTHLENVDTGDMPATATPVRGSTEEGVRMVGITHQDGGRQRTDFTSLTELTDANGAPTGVFMGSANYKDAEADGSATYYLAGGMVFYGVESPVAAIDALAALPEATDLPGAMPAALDGLGYQGVIQGVYNGRTNTTGMDVNVGIDFTHATFAASFRNNDNGYAFSGSLNGADLQSDTFRSLGGGYVSGEMRATLLGSEANAMAGAVDVTRRNGRSLATSAETFTAVRAQAGPQ